MNIECEIYLPPSREHKAWLHSRASQIFGGITTVPGSVSGSWEGPDGVESEPMVRHVVAVDSFADLALVVALAREAGNRWGERCVYVRALGMSEIVECERGAVR
jgi:hypothetical protein